jgi:hypothetical protein
MSNNATTAEKLQLDIIEPIIQDLLSHYDSEEVKRMWRLIRQNIEDEMRKRK